MVSRRGFLGTTAVGAISVQKNSKGVLAPTLESVYENLPAPPLDPIHDLLEKHCGPKGLVGCAISTSYLSLTLTEQLVAAKGAIAKLRYPTALPKIDAGLELDTTGMFLHVQGTSLLLKGFSPVIVLAEQGPQKRAYNRLTIQFDPVELQLDISPNGKDVLILGLKNQAPVFHTLPGSPDATVLSDNGLSLDDYRADEKAILAGTAPAEILQQFIQSIPLPAALTAMRTIGVAIPRDFVFDTGFLIITGPSGEAAGEGECSGAGIVYTEKETTAIPPTQPGQPNGGSVHRSVTASFAEPQQVGSGMLAVAYYYPKATFQVVSEHILRPSISLQDGPSTAFLFEWYYFASAALRSLAITADPTTATITLDAPLDLRGTVAVGLKVGCVYEPLLQSTVIGDADPSVFRIQLGIVTTPTGQVVQMACSYDVKMDIEFRGPPLVDVLLNIVMESFGNRLISQALSRKAAELSFPLIALGELAAAPPYGWRLAKNMRPESLLVVVTGREG